MFKNFLQKKILQIANDFNLLKSFKNLNNFWKKARALRWRKRAKIMIAFEKFFIIYSVCFFRKNLIDFQLKISKKKFGKFFLNEILTQNCVKNHQSRAPLDQDFKISKNFDFILLFFSTSKTSKNYC